MGTWGAFHFVACCLTLSSCCLRRGVSSDLALLVVGGGGVPYCMVCRTAAAFTSSWHPSSSDTAAGVHTACLLLSGAGAQCEGPGDADDAQPRVLRRGEGYCSDGTPQGPGAVGCCSSWHVHTNLTCFCLCPNTALLWTSSAVSQAPHKLKLCHWTGGLLYQRETLPVLELWELYAAPVFGPSDLMGTGYCLCAGFMSAAPHPQPWCDLLSRPSLRLLMTCPPVSARRLLSAPTS